MDFSSIETIISLAGLLLGGGGLLTWRYARQKAKAEASSAEAQASSAEAQATKELQDVYQQLIADIKTDRDEQKAYIKELKDDRANLRHDRDELRKRQDELENNQRELGNKLARYGRMVENMRPFLCGDMGCKKRANVSMSDASALANWPTPRSTD